MNDHAITLFESGATVTNRSIALYGLSYNSWEEGYKRLIEVEECGPFWIGDYLLWGEKTFGENFSQALDEDHAKTHLIYKYVCSRIEPSRRREALSFSIHREVCSIEDEATQEKILDVAERDKLTVREVRQLAKAAKGEMKPMVDYWEKFLKLLKEMWENLEEEVYASTVERIRQHLG